jgi:hypothetical protein
LKAAILIGVRAHGEHAETDRHYHRVALLSHLFSPWDLLKVSS